MSGKRGLTADRLRTLVTYDPLTGVFSHATAHPGKRKGAVSGTVNSRGYVLLRVDYVQYRAHRLAWLYMTGKWPAGIVDHIDGNPSNNAWANLRDVSHTHNMWNRRKAHKTNSSGLLGAMKPGNKWRARLRVNGRVVNIGTFDTALEAHTAYMRAKNEHHVIEGQGACPVGV